MGRAIIDMKNATYSRARLAGLLGTAALLAGLPVMAVAQAAGGTEGCALIDGKIPPGCARPEAGTVVRMPAGANTTDTKPTGALGPYGFAITIDAAPPEATDRARLAGADQAQDDGRRVDRILAEAGVQVTYDGLGVRPRLAISTGDMKSSYTAGSAVAFRASTNYPAWIAKSEIRLIERDDPTKVVAVIPVAANGTADWTMPAESVLKDGNLFYSLRVYDNAGRYDETVRLPISRSAEKFPQEPLDGPVIAPGEGEDMTARRSIPVRGGAVTVTGNTGGRGSVQVMGEDTVADPTGTFVIQRILPPGAHDIRVGLGRDSITRHVEIPRREWFYVGIADLTWGKEKGEGSYTLGRLAGYAKGNTAGGYTITASVDTGEGEIEDILRDLDAKNTRRVLDRIKSEDVYPTFGDDSTSLEDAPTSGKLYLKVQKDKTALTWGDFKAADGTSPLIRSDRTLYGLLLTHESMAQTTHGDAKLKYSAYGASPDRLVQRDVMRGTGGSAYFLKRQDILYGTETIYVQWRDPVSGNVVRSQRLTAGDDYEIDYYQGVIILKSPLSAAGGGGLMGDRPLGDYDVDLVAQYEYVPTTGNVDGYAAGGRVEGWVTDSLRLGASAAKDTTGVADTTSVGADVLWRKSDATWLSFDVAQSEGPGYDTSFSLNGGLDIDDDPSAGVKGQPANAIRLEGRADLEELTGGAMAGEVSAYFDRKEAGFVSADYDIDTTQTSWGLAGKLDLNSRTQLRLAYDNFRDEDGKKRQDGKVELAYDLTDQWTVETGIATTDRKGDPFAEPDELGQRTDVGARLTWTRDDDLKAWVFGLATVSRSGGLEQNNRLGFGIAGRLTDRLSAEGEVSGGSLGPAGRALLRWDNNAGTSYRFGYTLDPMRRFETDRIGTDGGKWVIGAESRVNDHITYRAENSYDLFGNERALTTAYGVRYTPSDTWAYDGTLEFGQTDDPEGGGTYTRRAIGAGVRYSNGDLAEAGLRAEYRNDESTDGARNRDNWLVKGYWRQKTSDDWRLLFDLAALVSESDQSSLRDGRYIEANLGWAYRPVANDRLNALFRYTYLEDLPGQDQVSIDGSLDGPRQRSHILSIDVDYDLNRYWTLGGKYGYRFSNVTDRTTNVFTKNTADLAILRLDYHVTHNWDLTLDTRLSHFYETDVTETGAMAAAYRHFGNNLKVGVGYQFGNVSDDLRLIDGRKEGVFLNIVGKF